MSGLESGGNWREWNVIMIISKQQSECELHEYNNCLYLTLLRVRRGELASYFL